MSSPNHLPRENKPDSEWKTLLRDMGSVFTTYFKGKVKIALILGVIAYALMWLLKIPYGALLSIIIAVFNLIPYIGPIIGAGVAIVVTLIAGSMTKALWVIGIVILLQILDSWYLEPKILGKAFGINPILIFVFVFIGGLSFGIPGMILAVPIAVILRKILKKYKDT